MDILIFKILKKPIDQLNPVQQEELERKIASSGNPKYLTSIIDFNLSDISYIATDIIEVEGGEITDFGDQYKGLYTFPEFVDYIGQYDKGLTYMGWNCGWYDIPQLKYESIKKQLSFPKACDLFNFKKYQIYPVYDLKENLFSWGYASSLLLTLDGLGIPYINYDVEQMFALDKEEEFINYIEDYVDNIKKIFIKSKGVLI